jgi:uncharacterized protein (DUF427 family)
LLPSTKRVVVAIGDAVAPVVIADTTGAYRVLETSHPPTWYLPRAHISPEALRPASSSRRPAGATSGRPKDSCR